jgi:biopolymer transport protein ExbB
MMELLVKGGVLMIPIAICSVLALAITIERLINLTLEKVHPPEFIAKIKRLLTQGKVGEAVAICTNTVSPIAHIIEAGILKRNQDREHIKEAIEQAGKQQATQLHKYIGVLATIASISPLLGLLGTVAGMIKVFQVISIKGVGNPGVLAGGISEALITTAAGLVVAIPTLVLHNYFYKRANQFVLQMENTSLELLDILGENFPVEANSRQDRHTSRNTGE